MFNLVSLTTSIAKLWSSLMTWINNLRQQELGAKESELEARKHADKISADIQRDINDPELLQRTRKRYTRDKL